MSRIVVFDDAAGASRSARKVDSNGYMHVSDCPVTKEQVAPYYGYEIPDGDRFGLDPDTIYYVYRPAEELSKPETLKSLRGIPLLLDHASVSPEDIRRDRIAGSVGDLVKWDGTYILCNLNILAKSAQDRINDKSMRELSLGYSYTPERKAGEFNGQHYDFVMRDIKANHLALVEVGRAGSDVRVCDSMPNRLMESNQVDNAILERLAEALGDLTASLAAAQAAAAEPQPVDPALDEDTINEEDEAEHRDPETPEGAVTKDTDPAEDEDPTADEDPTTDEDAVSDEDSVGDEDETADEDAVGDEDCTKDDDEILAKSLAALGVEASAENIATLRNALAGPAPAGANDSGAAVKRAMRTAGKRRAKGFAMDAATFNTRIKQAAAMGEKAAIKKMRRLNAAANQCAPILGRVDPLNFDSAGAIYQKAAMQAGLSADSARDPKVARGYVLAALKAPRGRSAIAMDSTPRDGVTVDLLSMLNKKSI